MRVETRDNWLHKNSFGGRRRNIPETSLIGWELLNGEHVSQLLVRDSL
jgi:hypothetical protein